MKVLSSEINMINEHRYTILIIDDDKSIRYSLRRIFERDYNVLTASNGEEGLRIFSQNPIDIIIMDIKMPERSGIEVLREIKEIDQKSLVILMTAYGTTETAIEAMKYGAFDYILKPFTIQRLKELIEKAIEIRKMVKERVPFKLAENEEETTERIVGSSQKMQEIYKVIGQVAPSDVTVILRGESGTGKELFARAIYHHSLRANRPFLPVNCAAIPDTLLESELFGHEKGAFTGAISRRIGKLEQCSGGTIFLDEIGDTSLSTQAKVLRVIQDKSFERLGGRETIKTDVRFIAATNKNLEEAISKGLFREDLYYRLNVVSIRIPPLRERKEDIPELVSYFISRFKRELKKDILGITPEAMKKINAYNWPGNVRQLENVIKRAMVLCQGQWILEDQILFEKEEERDFGRKLERRTFEELIDSIFEEFLDIYSSQKGTDIFSIIEKELILRALQKTNGNQVQAAKILGINRNTLRGKIDKYRIKKDILISGK